MFSFFCLHQKKGQLHIYPPEFEVLCQEMRWKMRPFMLSLFGPYVASALCLSTTLPSSGTHFSLALIDIIFLRTIKILVIARNEHRLE